MFTSVPRMWNAKTKLKIESFQQFISKEMSLNHAKPIDRLASDCKLDTKKATVKLPISISTPSIIT